MLLQTHQIVKNYGTDTVLSNISLQIHERQKIGLVGVNGAGKSTLLKIIAGELSYDSGTIHKAKETTLGYLAQNSGLQGQNTIWDEMMSAFSELLEMEQQLRVLENRMGDPELLANEAAYQDLMSKYDQLSHAFRTKGGYELETKVRAILHGLGFGQMDFSLRIDKLSGGQRTRLALAKLLLVAPDILVLDEPTNHLDLDTLAWLEGYLRSYDGAILIVSHDRYFLDAVVSVIYELERTQCKRYSGNYSKYVELKAAEYESELKAFEKQQDQVAKMEDFIRRNMARASTSNRAKSRQKALGRMDRLDRPQGQLKRASFSFEIERQTGRDVLLARNLMFAYEDQAPLFPALSLELKRGESVALIGPNGCGKSTLLKLLVNELQPASGVIEWGSHVKVGYYDQEQRQLSGNETVLEEVWKAYPHLEEARIRTVLGNFLFSGEDVFKRISALSGGERARVALAKLMLQEANVLILDEPTNHLDLFSKEVLEAALMEYEGTLLFISHDRYFLNKLAERVVELSSKGLDFYLGNYDDYLEKKQELEEIRQETARSTANPVPATPERNDNAKAADYFTQKQARQEERNRQRRLEQLEQAIQEKETQLASLESDLAQPEVYQDFQRVQSINEELEQTRQQLAAHYEEWETLI